ncbi:hypothetical protein Hanom_Chr05g00422931 [Helianthus anomalus]
MLEQVKRVFQNVHQCSTSSSDKLNEANRRKFDILFDEVLNILCDDDELNDNCAFI